jgi:hypothetical protein
VSLILSTNRNLLVPTRFYVCSISPVPALFSVHLIALHLIMNVYQLWSSSLYNFLKPPVTPSLLVPYILLSTLFLHTSQSAFLWGETRCEDLVEKICLIMISLQTTPTLWCSGRMTGVHSKKYAQHIHTLCGQHTELLVLNLAVNIVATRL